VHRYDMGALNDVWRRSRARVITPVAAVAIVLTACSSPAASSGSAANDQPIQIGVILSLTGANGATGQQQNSGLVTYVNDINKHGGVGGRQIQLKVLDDQSSATIDVQDFNELEGNQSTVALVGPTSTPGGTLVKPLAERDQIPYLAPLTTDSFSNPPNNWFFRTIPSISVEAKSLLQYAHQEGIHRIGLLYPEESLGQDAAADIQSEASSEGLTITASEAYPANTLDPSVQIQKVKESNPDAYIVYDGDDSARLTLTVKTMRSLGITAPIGAPLPASDPAFVQGVSPVGTGTKNVFYWAFSDPQQTTNDTETAFLKTYQAANKSAGTAFNLIGAEWGEILVGAIKNLQASNKQVTRTNLRDAIQKLSDFPTTLGSLTFTTANHNTPFPNTLVLVYTGSGSDVQLGLKP
jgi:branched-chain amino acid transport system substrate-binding protein